jgi:hypothetical protein
MGMAEHISLILLLSFYKFCICCILLIKLLTFIKKKICEKKQPILFIEVTINLLNLEFSNKILKSRLILIPS